MENIRKVINQEFQCVELEPTPLKELKFHTDDLKTKIFLNLENIIWSCTYRLTVRVYEKS